MVISQRPRTVASKRLIIFRFSSFSAKSPNFPSIKSRHHQATKRHREPLWRLFLQHDLVGDRRKRKLNWSRNNSTSHKIRSCHCISEYSTYAHYSSRGRISASRYCKTSSRMGRKISSSGIKGSKYNCRWYWLHMLYEGVLFVLEMCWRPVLGWEHRWMYVHW